MGSRRGGFVRTDKGYELHLRADVALAIRRAAREVQELIDSEPPVEGLAGVGPAQEEVTEDLGGFSDLQGMLAAGTLAGLAGLGGEVPPLSDDPALARLFPVAYEDPDEAEEYRRFTYAELHQAKIAGLVTFADQLATMAPDIVLDEDSAQVWLAAINDTRLVIGSRLGVSDDDAFDALPAGDARAGIYGVYVVLAELQESLIEALAGW